MAEPRETIERAFAMYYEDGMSQADIAEQLDVPRNTLHQWLVAKNRRQITWPLLKKYRHGGHAALVAEIERLRGQVHGLKLKNEQLRDRRPELTAAAVLQRAW